MNALVVRSISKAFRQQPVLRDVDLTLAQGTFTSVLGPSGSGKTTLLRVIAGFERVDSGEVLINGAVVDDGWKFVPPERRRIGYVPQEGSLFPHLTVEQNIAFGLHRSEDRAAIVARHIEMVDLYGLGRRYPHELSGGQQQRVALARALAINPSLVLMDEPFSALDASLRSAVRADVCRVIRASGATALLVTHDQDEALSISDSVAMIDNGHVGQVATPQQLYENPQTPEMARSLGEANFLTGTAMGELVDTPLGVLRLSRGSFPTGTDLLVFIRPEQLRAVQGDASGPQAVVIEREFRGHEVILRLAPSWQPSARLIARHLAVRHLDRDGQLTIGLSVSLTVEGTVLAWPREQ